jgi:hypothetical protein
MESIFYYITFALGVIVGTIITYKTSEYKFRKRYKKYEKINTPILIIDIGKCKNPNCNGLILFRKEFSAIYQESVIKGSCYSCGRIEL